MPGLLNVYPSCNNASKHDATNFAFGDRLDGHTESPHMLVGVWTH
jgi:hypothetical protein